MTSRAATTHFINFVHYYNTELVEGSELSKILGYLPRLSTRDTVENCVLRNIGPFKASGKELLTSRDSSNCEVVCQAYISLFIENSVHILHSERLQRNLIPNGP